VISIELVQPLNNRSWLHFLGLRAMMQLDLCRRICMGTAFVLFFVRMVCLQFKHLEESERHLTPVTLELEMVQEAVRVSAAL
jgi:hypothetical protein